jgi:hypothetical protein
VGSDAKKTQALVGELARHVLAWIRVMDADRRSGNGDTPLFSVVAGSERQSSRFYAQSGKVEKGGVSPFPSLACDGTPQHNHPVLS